MDNINYTTTHDIYDPIAAIAANKTSTTKYYVDRWGTVHRDNPNLPKPETHKKGYSGWEVGDSRR